MEDSFYFPIQLPPKNTNSKTCEGYSIPAILKPWEYSKTERRLTKCILSEIMNFIMHENKMNIQGVKQTVLQKEVSYEYREMWKSSGGFPSYYYFPSFLHSFLWFSSFLSSLNF